jgi:cardiolipin synthase
VKGLLRHSPNFLTSLRLAAAPATVVLLMTEHYVAAFGVFLLAGASDAVDGYLAKRFGLMSKLGSWLDPAADKALMLAVFITLSMPALGVVPVWLTLLVLAREALFVLAIGAATAFQAPLTVRPLLIGKLGTALQILYLSFHLAALAFGFSLETIAPQDAMVLATVIVISIFSYGALWLRAMRAPRGEGSKA